MKKLTTNDAVSVIFHPEKYFCHATDVENVQSIIDNGLRANEDGDIFVFEPCRFKMYGEIFFVGDVIADGQLFLRDKYAIFYIKKKDVFGEVFHDNVGEFTASVQHFIKQKIIQPFRYWVRENEYSKFIRNNYEKIFHC